jgi:hypothetical protein
MADVMSVDEAKGFDSHEAGLHFGTIVVVGGGCYGSYYVRQLRRAARAGAVTWDRVLVVDRNPQCALGAQMRDSSDGLGNGIDLVVSDWREFFGEYLDRAARDRAGTRDDAIVPSPLMPHLMFEWIRDRARGRWPDREVVSKPLDAPPDTPWQRATDGGPHYVSFAVWTCPINCVEPRICPHTRELRSWTMPETARAYVDAETRQERPLVGPVIFHCTHRAYGVGMFDTREVVAGDDLVRSAGETSAADILVGTMSHCHGAFERLAIGPPARRFAESAH